MVENKRVAFLRSVLCLSLNGLTEILVHLCPKYAIVSLDLISISETSKNQIEYCESRFLLYDDNCI